MKYCSNFKYDLEVGQAAEKEIGEMLSKKKIEIKKDMLAKKTGNVFVEYNSRGKSSGIANSQSDYYCFAFGDSLHLLPTEKLKEKCRRYIGTLRDVRGGDSNTSHGILLPIDELLCD